MTEKRILRVSSGCIACLCITSGRRKSSILQTSHWSQESIPNVKSMDIQ